MARLLPFLIVLLCGCEPAQDREIVDLVDAGAWRILGSADDPFPEHRADAKRLCSQGGFGEDLGVLDIDTNQCAYVSATQETLADVRAGDAISLLSWHQALASVDEGAQGHLAFVLDGEPLWDVTVPIPAAAQLYDVAVPMNRDVPAGAEIVVHVHNHGGNTWRVAHARAVPPEHQTEDEE